MGPNGVHYTEIPLYILIILYVSDGDVMGNESHHACTLMQTQL